MIRGATISYSSHIAKVRRKYEAELKNELIRAENNLANNPNENDRQEFITITLELESLNNQKSRGNQIRTRATHIELNEKNSAYFFSNEKTNYNIKNISAIHRDDGTIVTDPKQITQCQKEFYQKLYTEPV